MSIDNIRPVCLPNSNDPNHVGHSVTLTGWGSTLPSGTNLNANL